MTHASQSRLAVNISLNFFVYYKYLAEIRPRIAAVNVDSASGRDQLWSVENERLRHTEKYPKSVGNFSAENDDNEMECIILHENHDNYTHLISPESPNERGNLTNESEGLCAIKTTRQGTKWMYEAKKRRRKTYEKTWRLEKLLWTYFLSFFRCSLLFFVFQLSDEITRWNELIKLNYWHDRAPPMIEFGPTTAR